MSDPEETPPLVRQRNTTGYMVNVAETKDHPAYSVQPGEEAEFPVLMAGWTPIDEPAPDVKTAEVAPKTPSRKRAAAADQDQEGGESQ